MGAEERNRVFCETVVSLLKSYSKFLVVKFDNVGSNILRLVRSQLKDDAVFLTGENSLIKRAINEHAKKTGNTGMLNLELQGNVGLIFTHGDLKRISETIAKFKEYPQARAGLVAPVDVVLQPYNTGLLWTALDPSQKSIFQILKFPTRLINGTLAIVSQVVLIRKGNTVGSLEAKMLSTLRMRPFSYGLIIHKVFMNGSAYDPIVLELADDIAEKFPKGTDDYIATRIAQGFADIAATSLELSYPILINGYMKSLQASEESKATPEAAVPEAIPEPVPTEMPPPEEASEFIYETFWHFPPGFYEKNPTFWDRIPIERREILTFHFLQIVCGPLAALGRRLPYNKELNKHLRAILDIIYPCLSYFSRSLKWRGEEFNKHMLDQDMSQEEFENFLIKVYQELGIKDLMLRLRRHLEDRYKSEGREVTYNYRDPLNPRLEVTYREFQEALNAVLPGYYPRFQIARIDNRHVQVPGQSQPVEEYTSILNQIIFSIDKNMRGSEKKRGIAFVTVETANEDTKLLINLYEPNEPKANEPKKPKTYGEVIGAAAGAVVGLVAGFFMFF